MLVILIVWSVSSQEGKGALSKDIHRKGKKCLHKRNPCLDNNLEDQGIFISGFRLAHQILVSSHLIF